MIQKSYNNKEEGKLILIPTPIGNMADITLRAIDTLKEADIVFAEDTRVTIQLLKHYDINKKVVSCHKYSEMKNKDEIIFLLKSGKKVALVTDRGTPLISDPGSIIVENTIKENISVIALPGPSALLPAINMSGLSNEKFLFYGFLNSKNSIAKNELKELEDEKYTLILYESPHRIQRTLQLMLEVFGDRNIALVREISKIYEEVIREKISNIIEYCDTIKGEIVIVVEGNSNNKEENVDYVKEVNELIKKGYSRRDAINEIADKYNISKNKIYNEIKEWI